MIHTQVEESTAAKRVAAHSVAVAVGKSTLFGVLANFVQVGTRIFTVPVVITHMGLEGYGIWSIIMTTGAYMRFGAAGLKSAFQKYVAEAMGSGNFLGVNQLISTGSAAMLVASLIGLLPVAIFSKVLARHSGVPERFVDSTAGSFELLAILMIISNFAAVYEAIVAGTNRIELLKKFNIVQAILEAAAIVTLLHFGYGLLAMTAVMAVSELALIACCYLASSRILPQVRLGIRYISRSVVRELVRFAGSYQILNVLEIVYITFLPICILKLFGAHASGVYALCGRLVAAAVMFQESSLLPLLSGGAAMYASATRDHVKFLISKAFKWTLVLSAPFLVFLSVFGTMVIMAWTGQADPLFKITLWLSCAAALFKAVSRVGFVIYRVTGGSSLDIIRQVICIVPVAVAAFLGREVGYLGIFVAVALGELLGMLFMFLALGWVIEGFNVRMLVPDAAKLLGAVAGVVAIGAGAAALSSFWSGSGRLDAALRLALAALGCAIVIRPALSLTRFLSTGEQRAIMDTLLRRSQKQGIVEVQA